jgi:hypothetical protein
VCVRDAAAVSGSKQPKPLTGLQSTRQTLQSCPASCEGHLPGSQPNGPEQGLTLAKQALLLLVPLYHSSVCVCVCVCV